MKNPPIKKLGAGRSKGIFGIDDAEWDFNKANIPSKSVLDCLLYEYARELIKRTPEAANALKKLQEAKSSNDSERRWSFYSRLASILQTRAPGSVLIYEYMDEVPWVGFQRLLEKERQAFIQAKKRGNPRRKVTNGKKNEDHKTGNLDEQRESDDLLYQGEGLVLLKNPPYEPGKRFESFCRYLLAANTILDTDVRRESCGFFAVDWKSSIPEILDSFKVWLLHEKKRMGITSPERRGGISDQEKAYRWLNALGAYRLMTMTRLSVEKMIDIFENRLSRKPLYSNAPEWSRAKRSVEEAMQSLFSHSTARDS
jgi:hypothetical protein